jgi:hypothetical protein
MTKAEQVMEKIGLSSELLERAFIKANKLGRYTQAKLFRTGQNNALNREIKELLGPEFEVDRRGSKIQGTGKLKTPRRHTRYEEEMNWK